MCVAAGYRHSHRMEALVWGRTELRMCETHTGTYDSL